MYHLFSDSTKQKEEDDKMLEKRKVRHSSLSISEKVVFICGSHLSKFHAAAFLQQEDFLQIQME